MYKYTKMSDDLVLRCLDYLVAECEYERMIDQYCSAINPSLSYDDFVLYNKSCLEELSPKRLKWVWRLCKELDSEKIRMMDLEDCNLWKASCLFYDLNKNIVIVHPR